MSAHAGVRPPGGVPEGPSGARPESHRPGQHGMNRALPQPYPPRAARRGRHGTPQLKLWERPLVLRLRNGLTSRSAQLPEG